MCLFPLRQLAAYRHEHRFNSAAIYLQRSSWQQRDGEGWCRRSDFRGTLQSLHALSEAKGGETRYTSGTSPTTFKYTGQREEASFGLYYYAARWYDAALGCFAQADTIVPEGVQGWDRYAYVNNNPVKYTDPSGHDVGCAGYDAGLCSGGNLQLAAMKRIAMGIYQERSYKFGYDPNPEETQKVLRDILKIEFNFNPEQLTTVRKVAEIKFKLSEIDWTDIIIDVIGFSGDIGLFGGAWEWTAFIDTVEMAGFWKDVQDGVAGDPVGLGLFALDKSTINWGKIIPGGGSIFNFVDAMYAVLKGFFVEYHYLDPLILYYQNR